MLVKFTAEMVTALGAKDPADCLAKLSAIMQENSTLKQNMSEQTTTLADVIKRIDALESKIVGEAKIAEMVSGQVKAGLEDSKAGIEKIASAAASKMAADALASVGTAPVKPSPAPAAQDENTALNALLSAGKYEEAYAMLPAKEKSEFMGAKSYAAFMKHRGQIRIATRN